MKKNPVGSTDRPEFNEGDIFKYGSAQNAKRMLTGVTLGFSKLKDFNDPFESSFAYTHSFKSMAERQEFYNSPMNNNQWSLVDNNRALIKEILSKQVVSCFSKTPFEPLMWAHYSDKHTGVCCCFHEYQIFDSRYKKIPVEYSNMFPRINFFNGTTTMSLLNPQIENIIARKSYHWSYEQELRFSIESEIKIHQFNPVSLLGVVLGTNLTSTDEKEIIELVKVYNTTHNTDVRIMYATPSSTGYAMQIECTRVDSHSVDTPIYDINSPII